MGTGNSSLGDPNMMALLGALAGTSQFAGASRLPQTFGQALGGAGAGLMAGIQQGQKYQQGQQELTKAAIDNAQALDALRTMQIGYGNPNPPSKADILSGKFEGTPPDILQKFFQQGMGGGESTAPQVPGSALQSQIPGTGAATPSAQPGTPQVAAAGGGGAAPSALKDAIWDIEGSHRLTGVPDGSSGEIGPMQIMPATGAMYGANEEALRNPQTNLAIGQHHIDNLYAKYGDPAAVGVAYNAGSGVADKWIAGGRDNSILPDKTQNYLKMLQPRLAQYAQASGTTMTDAGVGGAPPQQAGVPQQPGVPQGGGMPGLPQMMANIRFKQAMKIPLTPVENMMFTASQYPPGSPMRAMLTNEAIKQSGVQPFIGGERSGVPGRRYNPATGNYDFAFSNPQAPQGFEVGAGAGGRDVIREVPGGPAAVEEHSTRAAAGPATFKPETYHDIWGNPVQGTARQAPNFAAGAPGMGGGASGAAAGPPIPLGGGTSTPAPPPPSAPQTGLPNPAAAPPAGPAPGGAAQPPESAAPTFTANVPTGPKDISQVSINDMFPGGAGIPQPTAAAGPPTKFQEEVQKDDADRFESYTAEQKGNQQVNQNLLRLRGVLDRGFVTGSAARIGSEMANLAHSLGADWAYPVKWAPASAAEFDKASTALIFAALKTLPGQVKVAEITGLQKANPNLTIPRETNYQMMNDILATSKWQDERARLATDFMITHKGVPLSVFDAAYNRMAPLPDVANNYMNILRQNGAVFPEDVKAGGGGGSNAAPLPPKPVESRVIGGQTYHKFGNQWYKLNQ